MYPLLRTDPAQVGPYALEARLGAGGMGVVYLGVRADGTRGAVKVIRQDLAMDRRFRRQFAREIDVLSTVGTSYATEVLDADIADEVPWFATAYVAGPSLADRVYDSGPLPEAELQLLTAGLAQAMCALHAADVIHRDIKPANVVLTGSGPVLIDFGIAAVDAADRCTAMAIRTGSPAWMAPEEVTGEDDLTGAVDVFATALTVAFAATGRSPYGRGPVQAVLYRVVHQPPDLTGVPASLMPALSAALRRTPVERPDARTFLAMLPAAAIDSDPLASGALAAA